MKLVEFVLVAVGVLGLVTSDASIDTDLYQIEHSVNMAEFVPIGQVNVRLLKQTQNAAQYQSLETTEASEKAPLAPPAELPSTEIDTFKLDKTQLDRIELASANNNSIYQVRICKKLLPNQQQKCLSSTFTYLRNVVESSMAFQLTIHSGLNNNINSISIKPWSSTSSENKSSRGKRMDSLTVYASVQTIRPAAGPDTDSYLEKLRIEKEQKEKSAQSGNESFLSKYWMYIVPFVIVMFLMNLVNPEAGGPGGGGGGGR